MLGESAGHAKPGAPSDGQPGESADHWLETLAEEFREWRTARDKCSEWCDRKRGTTSKSFALRF